MSAPRLCIICRLVVLWLAFLGQPFARASFGAEQDSSVQLTGEFRLWHKITLTVAGPMADESDRSPNPFTDYAMTVVWSHESGETRVVPGYFAADGRAANTGADGGDRWRAHFAPHRIGRWNYQVRFERGDDVALGAAGELMPEYSRTGSVMIEPSDKTWPDMRARGLLRHDAGHYLRFAGSGEYFLKAGPDSPETLLAYQDFDGTVANKPTIPLKQWRAHTADWREEDPTWRDGLGKGLIGAINYLADKGCNSISFLPYNAGGDGDNVWPFTARDDPTHFDCSKLDQWQIVFDHANNRGLFLHFKLQETEIDDNRPGHGGQSGHVPAALDGGDLGPTRKLYLREMIARFGHELALNWNLGEENSQTTDQQRAMIDWIRRLDSYDHPIVVHTYPDWQDRVYTPWLGVREGLDGVSLQNSWRMAHARVRHWRALSAAAENPWVVCCDEQNPASHGVPPDAGYRGHDGWARVDGQSYNRHDIRKQTLWGTLMAGGAGVEYYFGYRLSENDLLCEDFRSRDRAWDDCRIALNFFRNNWIPFHEMENHDEWANAVSDGLPATAFCFSKPDSLWLVYLPDGGTCRLRLGPADSPQKKPQAVELDWFNPRTGESVSHGRIQHRIEGIEFSAPDRHDWLAVIRSTEK